MGFWLSFTQAGLYHVFVTSLNPQRSATSHCNGSSMILKLQYEFLLGVFSLHCIMATVWRSFCVAPLDSAPSLLESAAYRDGRNSRCKEIKGST